ncbi:TPA: signal recognition particle-docking protein FtsY, partial [Candidatus Poribacteria bacterium]|nr:signal recognition particle-docking protein FtsY [Candidatus Poribacteria bacterium]
MLRGIFSGKKGGLFDRLRDGLSKTRQNILGKVSSLIQGRARIDEELMEEIEEVLIQADVGVETTLKLMDRVRETVKERRIEEPSLLIGILKEEMLRIFGEDEPLDVSGAKPYSIMILGVNGVGKTTTIGKLAARFKDQGLKVLVAAGDTFRAAASDQLEIWCQRAGVELIKGAEGGDPA